MPAEGIAGDLCNVVLGTHGISVKTVSNKASEYIPFEVNDNLFSHTPLYDTAISHEYPLQLQYRSVINGEPLSHITNITPAEAPFNWYISSPRNISPSEFFSGVNLLAYAGQKIVKQLDIMYDEDGYPIFDENGEPVWIEIEVQDNVGGIETPIMHITEDDIQYLPAYAVYNPVYIHTVGGRENEEKIYPGIEPLTFSQREKTVKFGESCPVVSTDFSFAERGWDPGTYNIGFEPVYIGILGEKRLSDLFVARMSVKHNGNEIASLEDLTTLYPAEGTLEVEVIDENVEIDGIKGFNHLYIHNGLNGDDKVCPTVQFMQMRDGDNGITNRFNTGEDAEILLCSGDYEAFVPDFFWYELNDEHPTVKMEYSPLGSDQWSALTVESDDSFKLIQFGYLYRATLDAVDAKSESGWFDLRITCTDAAGNYQVQTLSPAFRVESQVGLQQIENYSEDGEAVWYNLQGVRLSAPAPGLNICVRNGRSEKMIIQ